MRTDAARCRSMNATPSNTSASSARGSTTHCVRTIVPRWPAGSNKHRMRGALAVHRASAFVGDDGAVKYKVKRDGYEEDVDPAEALKTGLVDDVVALDRVVEAARTWCEQVVSVPLSALSETRTRLRADLVGMIERHRDQDTRRLAHAWFEPELQAAMKQLVARLKGK